ncbi:MAG: chemotaxis-specific protein-glutamate methyltransferase CheB [Lachnospiraceae bacterium]|nr:chemotaxis-specific protein-glutamate methyltransferase CheB [Lachnospiraceae bacterium]
MGKNILVVDDSALMRMVMCDILKADDRFQVADIAKNGKEALDLLTKKKYDAVVLDVNMPIMGGLELLKQLQVQKIPARVMMASTDTRDGAKVTLDALELGAIDFVHKSANIKNNRTEEFQKTFKETLYAVACSREPVFGRNVSVRNVTAEKKFVSMVRKHTVAGNKIVAIASSTGGPKALQAVIPKLPKDLNAPVVLVQHMPVGFTKSLAERLDALSEVTVSEAREGEILQKGHVYLSKGGMHMNVTSDTRKSCIHYSDEPSREGVKPCANYMYESLINSPFDQVVCVVLTGMGLDGTAGIRNLKAKKQTYVIAQQENTCAVYGMPKGVVKAGLANQIVELDNVAQEIIMNVGVK